MKKILSVLLCLSLVILELSTNLFATDNYNRPVNMIGQWTNESATQEDTIKEFHSSDEKLGLPKPNSGLLRGLAKNFLGWSTQPLTKEKKLPDGARLYSKDDTIATVFPEGIPDNAQLYAIYFELTEGPLIINNFFDNMKLLKLSDPNSYKPINEGNAIYLNRYITDEDTLPDTTIIESKSQEDGRYIVDKPDVNTDNSLNINSEFQMSQIVSMLVYKNPIGSNALLPIFSRNYNTLKNNNGFRIDDPDYTYVDLVVELDEGFSVGEAFNLEFKSYSWRPIYVLDDQNQKMEIANLLTNESLGNTNSSFDTLISNKSPKVSFTVLNPNKKHTIKIRLILRNGENEKIPEDSIIPTEGRTIAEEITQNMTLNALSKNQVKLLRPNLSDEDLLNQIISIKKDRIEKMLNSNEQDKQPLSITGHIIGKAVTDAGEVGSGLFRIPLKAEIAINRVDVDKPIYISFRKEKGQEKENEYDDSNIDISKDLIDIILPPSQEKPLNQETLIKEKDLVPNTSAFSN